MAMTEMIDAEKNLELGVKSEKRLQQVLLAPETKLLLQPLLWVVPGEEDIVNVNDHAGRQSRDHLEEEVIDISSAADDVR